METLEPFNIIYQPAEDGLGDTVKPRLMEADADLERVLVIDDRDTPLTLSADRGRVKTRKRASSSFFIAS